jgi:hypothetical protein
MIKWPNLLLGLLLLVLALFFGTHGKVSEGATEATFVVT